MSHKHTHTKGRHSCRKSYKSKERKNKTWDIEGHIDRYIENNPMILRQ